MQQTDTRINHLYLVFSHFFIVRRTSGIRPFLEISKMKILPICLSQALWQPQQSTIFFTD